MDVNFIIIICLNFVIFEIAEICYLNRSLGDPGNGNKDPFRCGELGVCHNQKCYNHSNCQTNTYCDQSLSCKTIGTNQSDNE